jgi:hypothetical protein
LVFGGLRAAQPDVRPGIAGGEDLFTNCLELQRPEFAGRLLPVQPPHRPQGIPHVGKFTTGFVTVVALRVFQIGHDQFGDRDDVLRLAECRGAARRQPFGDQAIVFDPAGLRLPGAKIVASAVDLDDGLMASPVLAILGNFLRKTWHVRPPGEWKIAKRVYTRLAHQKMPHCRPPAGNRNSCFGCT